jgi:hypothetical protein
MKKFNSFLSSIVIALVCMLSVQTALAVDVPLKADNGAYTAPPRRRAPVVIPVAAVVYDNALVVNFDYSVGIAQVTVTDENGTIVYQDGIDTNVVPVTYVDVAGWNAGKYTLQITYGSIALKGTLEV